MIVSAQFNRGAGLGNKLFPWARAKLFALRHNLPMLRTRWFSPHGGAITRGGVDYRRALAKVWLAGNFKSNPDEVSTFKFLLKYRNLPVVTCDDLSFAESVLKEGTPTHIMFKWDARHDFLEFDGAQGFLKDELRRIVRKSQLEFVDLHGMGDFIAMNVRCGKDFVEHKTGNGGYVKTDLAWFSRALGLVRQQYGDMPALVVSDGGPRDLRELLAAPNVRLLRSPTAAADLLVLSRARVLLGSGNSTFSAWASFLGEMDTFSSPETPFMHAGLEKGRSGTKMLGVIDF